MKCQESEKEKEDVLPKLAKASDGKLQGLTFPGLAASCPGTNICPVKADEIRKMGKL